MTRLPKDIRTYTFSEFEGNNPSFSMKRLEDLYRSNHGESDIPHRHDYYTIIFFEKGNGTHIIDFTEYKIEDSTIYFIVPGQMHQVIPASEPKGWTMKFTDEFLIANAISDKLIDNIYLFNDFGQSPPLTISEAQLPVYLNIISQIDYFSNVLENYTQEAIGALLKLFLIQSNNHCSLHKSNNPQLQETTNQLLYSFKQLLNKHYAAMHMVSDYADKLAVTADYLNKTVKSITGKSAKEHIQGKIIIEAKRILLFSDISSKELAYELGYEESAHFNNFFKKMTGLTPSEFRISARQS
ncbi:AraC family transcriptional regulator [Bacteroides sedimenti]|uniref:AraC family transcriptional regulator n=2 Tax=Bacteroides sedimenti TaxID=2136147 RepID=A0ABM8IGU8_9BACE